MEQKVRNCIMLDLYGEFLTPRQRELANLYFNEDMSLAEISEQYGITRQGVRDGIKRAEHTLEEMERKLSLTARELKIQACVDRCVELSEAGTELSDRLHDLQAYLQEH